ncbi:polysialyltransferase family glycosyltransferase [Pseudomonas kulmbachensis]|uniref:Polysialyltransferase family glycosyltransferase n=1 Tax=Pseudomonas kulmbachensis TaxID=3043408 RepID=A0ABW7LVT1_9PSED
MQRKYSSCFFCNTPLQLLYAIQVISIAFKSQSSIIFYDGPETSTDKKNNITIVKLLKSNGVFYGATDQKNGTTLKTTLFSENKKLNPLFEECVFLFPNICWPTNNFLFFSLKKIIADKYISFYYEGIGSYLSHKQSLVFRSRNSLKTIISTLSERNIFYAYSGNFMYGKFSKTLGFYGPSIGRGNSKFENYTTVELPDNLFNNTNSSYETNTTGKQCLILGWSADSHTEQLTFIQKAIDLLNKDGLHDLAYKPHPLQRKDNDLLSKIIDLGLTIIESNDAVERLYNPKKHAAIISPFSSSLLHIKSKYPNTRCIAIIDEQLLKKGAKFGALHESEIRALFSCMAIEVYN